MTFYENIKDFMFNKTHKVHNPINLYFMGYYTKFKKQKKLEIET